MTEKPFAMGAEMIEKHEVAQKEADKMGTKAADKWVMHIIGPDDVIEYPDEITALRKANELNKEMMKARAERHPHDPVILAVAKNAAVEEV